MTMRVLVSASINGPDMNSKAMTKLCNEIDKRMWDADQALIEFSKAAKLVAEAFDGAGKAVDRDEARSQESTDLVIQRLRKILHPPEQE